MLCSDIERAKEKVKEAELKCQKAQTAYLEARLDLLNKLRRERIQCLVGLCYEDDDRYFIISEVPEISFYKDGEFFINLYELPAIVIDKQLSFPYETTIHTKAVDTQDPKAAMLEMFSPISKEEFKRIYHERVHDMLNKYISDIEEE